jgi:hypothetical protein
VLLSAALATPCPATPCPAQPRPAQPCPACQLARNYAADTKNTGKQKIAKELSARSRIYAVILVRKTDPVTGELNGESQGPLLWAFSDTMKEKLDGIFNNKKSGGNFLDVHRGFDLVLSREGEGMDTKYELSAVRELSPLGTEEQIEGWLENYPDLAQLTVLPEYEEVLEKLGSVPNREQVFAVPGQAAPAATSGKPARALPAAPANPKSLNKQAKPAAQNLQAQVEDPDLD